MKQRDSKIILILGGGTMQIPALTCARRRGWTVILADGNPEPEGKSLAHHFENVDLRDIRGMVDMAVSYSKRIGLDGVFTAGTDFSLTVAHVASVLGLPGIDVATAERATFKDIMRSCFADAGVPSPDFRIIDSGNRYGEIPEQLPGPWVVKPVDNMGARGTCRVDDPPALYQAIENALFWSRSSRVIVEEYMEGPEYSIDAIVENGRITVCGLADRHIFFPPFFIEMGHTMPTDTDEGGVKEVLRVFSLGVEALGIRNGVAKGDVKLTSGGARIGEIAARLSGGYMSGWTYPYSSGVDLTGAALNIAVGLPAGDLEPRHFRHSAERAFISVPGVAERILGVDEARAVPGVMDIFLRIAPGDRVTFPRNNVEKCGNVITRADTRIEAIAAAEEAATTLSIRLQPGNEETGMSLFGPPVPGMPAAYAVRNRTVLEDLEKMPFFTGSPNPCSSVPGIIPLRGIENETAREWHGRSLSAGLEWVYDSGTIARSSRESLRLGRIFWTAFLRGGPEAGIWAVRSFLADPEGFMERMTIWSGT